MKPTPKQPVAFAAAGMRSQARMKFFTRGDPHGEDMSTKILPLPSSEIAPPILSGSSSTSPAPTPKITIKNEFTNEDPAIKAEVETYSSETSSSTSRSSSPELGPRVFDQEDAHAKQESSGVIALEGQEKVYAEIDVASWEQEGLQLAERAKSFIEKVIVHRRTKQAMLDEIQSLPDARANMVRARQMALKRKSVLYKERLSLLYT